MPTRPRHKPTREHVEMVIQIKAIARQQMAEHGTAGLSLRGIARELHVTAPAIYNYFPRLEDLITALIVDAFTALAEAMEAADDAVMAKGYAARILALCLAYRQWAVDHPVDFQLIYGNPIPGYEAPAEITVPLATRPFLRTFDCFQQAHRTGELSIPTAYQDVPAPVAAHLEQWKRESSVDLPDGVVGLLVSGWARIHGLVMLELFHHVEPLIGDCAAFYRYEVVAFLRHMGMMLASEDSGHHQPA